MRASLCISCLFSHLTRAIIFLLLIRQCQLTARRTKTSKTMLNKLNIFYMKYRPCKFNAPSVSRTFLKSLSASPASYSRVYCSQSKIHQTPINWESIYIIKLRRNYLCRTSLLNLLRTN